MNGKTPYATTNNDNYEMGYTNRGYDDRQPQIQTQDQLPGYALYNGMLDRPGQRMSLPPGPPTANGPPFGR